LYGYSLQGIATMPAGWKGDGALLGQAVLPTS